MHKKFKQETTVGSFSHLVLNQLSFLTDSCLSLSVLSECNISNKATDLSSSLKKEKNSEAEFLVL